MCSMYFSADAYMPGRIRFDLLMGWVWVVLGRRWDKTGFGGLSKMPRVRERAEVCNLASMSNNTTPIHGTRGETRR